MPISPSDTRFAIIKEVTAGTTPATPTFLTFPYIMGTEPMLTSDTVVSPTVRDNRASGGLRKVNYRVEGGLKSQLQRSTVFEPLLESALSGAFATNVLKAGKTDVNLTIEKTMFNGVTPYYHRYVGCQVSKFSLSVSSDAIAEVGFDVVGLDRATAAAAIASSAYTAASTTTLQLAGIDLNTVTVAGLTAVCRSIELSVEHDREAHDQLGSAAALAVGTGGNRRVTCTMQFYRTDLSPDTLFAKSDTAVAVSFRVGTAADGWQFDIPAANYNVPQDETDNSKQLFTVEFTARYDSTAATDFIVTKLA